MTKTLSKTRCRYKKNTREVRKCLPQDCFEQTTEVNGTRTKSYGCVKRKDCIASASIVGRRSSQSNTTTYCKKELCNKDTHHFVAPPTEPCVDISARDCRDPAALEAICSDCELAQYCRKSCGLCQEHTGTTTWSENLVLFDFNPAHDHCNFSQAIGPSICHSIKARGQVTRNADYLNLPTHDSFYQVNFTTNGEPLTNVQLLSCRTTGQGRVDIILNNVTIVEAYNETSIWAWDWILHELNPAQHKGTHNYTLTIVKDRKIKNYGYYWLRNIRLETTVVHHGHRK
ncbi:uncharacterized protein LOC128158357 isoform X2 [Crassostrea angulata]|uniref:uncharacterized protein LOC128158357 isoform X2 n=1 Tax=Magallana angulata TaxID=2784310 RepID=UPI0022B1CC49|nr:uncharacterized protein LOC128158357 isoform X2 [Crassostrea angulata]